MKALLAMTLLTAALLGFDAQAAPAIREDDSSITISSGKSKLVFSKRDGAVKSLRFNGTEFVQGGFGFRPLFWRSPNEKDIQDRIPERSAKWKDYTQQCVVTGTKTGTDEDGAVYLRVTYDSGCELTYRLRQDGALHVQFILPPTEKPFREPVILDGPGMMYNPDQPEEERQKELEEFRAWTESVKKMARLDWMQEVPLLPRVGLRMHLPDKFFLEESDGRLAVTDRRSRGFVLLPNPALQYSAPHKTLEDIEAGSPVVRPFRELSIDAVPTDDSGYFLPSDEIAFEFTLIPVSDAATLDVVLR